MPTSQVPNFPLYTIYCNNFEDASQELARVEKKRIDVKHFLDVGGRPRWRRFHRTSVLSGPAAGALTVVVALMALVRLP